MGMPSVAIRSDSFTSKCVGVGLLAVASGSSIGTIYSAEHENYQHFRLSPSARATSGTPSQSTVNALGSIPDLIPVTFHRPTTQYERTIAELRNWHTLTNNWDGEGSSAPLVATLRSAEKFTGLLGGAITAPEPMLNATGRAGLFWDRPGLYADLEFYPNNKIAYYIEKNGDKHKGTVAFQEEQLPAMFAFLLANS